MKALAVIPGQRDSARLIEVPRPAPGPREVLARVLGTGVDGTDVEINAGLYGEAPPGSEHLILGHECLGRVEAVGDEVVGLHPGDLVAPTVRRPDDCPNCQAGEPDMCLKGEYKERGIKGLHGFMTEYFVEGEENLVRLPEHLADIGVLLEPLSVVEKAVNQAYRIQERMHWQPRQALVLGAGPLGILATALLRRKGLATHTLALRPRGSFKANLVEAMGATYVDAREHRLEDLAHTLDNIDVIFEATGSSSVAFQAMCILGTNGVLCLTGVSAGNKALQVPADALNLAMVLGNKAVFGSVNANIRDWRQAAVDLAGFEAQWPGLMARVITKRLPLERFSESFRRGPDGIKTVVEPGT